MREGPETFVAYPRDMCLSFEPQVRATVAAAVTAGREVGAGRPFDVHSSRGCVAWVWEQRTS